MRKSELGLKEGRYIRRPRWLSAIPCRLLNENGKAVWCYLADNVHPTKDIAFPSHDAISFNLGLSLDSAKSALDSLRSLGLVDWVRTGSSNTFTVNSPRELIDADLRVAAMESAKPEGEPHDYKAYRKVFAQAVKRWKATFKIEPAAMRITHAA